MLVNVLLSVSEAWYSGYALCTKSISLKKCDFMYLGKIDETCPASISNNEPHTKAPSSKVRHCASKTSVPLPHQASNLTPTILHITEGFSENYEFKVELSGDFNVVLHGYSSTHVSSTQSQYSTEQERTGT